MRGEISDHPNQTYLRIYIFLIYLFIYRFWNDSSIKSHSKYNKLQTLLYICMSFVAQIKDFILNPKSKTRIEILAGATAFVALLKCQPIGYEVEVLYNTPGTSQLDSTWYDYASFLYEKSQETRGKSRSKFDENLSFK